jgi:hypothetical protein
MFGGGENTLLVGGGEATADPSIEIGSILRLFRMMTDVAVVMMLFVTQYTQRAEGTLSENHPIINGRTFRKAGCCAFDSGGVISSIERY